VAANDPILVGVRARPMAIALLAGLFDFDITRAEPVEKIRLESGLAVDAVAVTVAAARTLFAVAARFVLSSTRRRRVRLA
jgi:hypothetical protein